MKGVEKGYRLYREGKVCMPLALTKIDDIRAPVQGSGEADVHFEGNPQFPVTLSLMPSWCSEPGACQIAERVIDGPSESPVKLRLTCDGPGTGTATWRTVMRDADGITTAVVEHRQTCARP